MASAGPELLRQQLPHPKGADLHIIEHHRDLLIGTVIAALDVTGSLSHGRRSRVDLDLRGVQVHEPVDRDSGTSIDPLLGAPAPPEAAVRDFGHERCVLRTGVPALVIAPRTPYDSQIRLRL